MAPPVESPHAGTWTSCGVACSHLLHSHLAFCAFGRTDVAPCSSRIHFRRSSTAPPASTCFVVPRHAAPPPPWSYDVWQYAWRAKGTRRPEASSSRRGPHRKRKQREPWTSSSYTPKSAWQSAPPSSPSSHARGSRGSRDIHQAHVRCTGCSWSRCRDSSLSLASDVSG